MALRLLWSLACTVVLTIAAGLSAQASRQGSGFVSDDDNFLSPVALLVRCYAHLTGQRISQSDPRFLSVVAGADPVDVCEEVLDQAMFTPNGVLNGVVMNGIAPSSSSLSGISDESVKVLKTFYSYFTTWFKNENVYQLAANVNENVSSFADSNNLKEPAGHVTRAFFQPGVRVEELVTGQYMMEEIRSHGRATSGPTTGAQAPVEPRNNEMLWQMASLTPLNNGGFQLWDPGFPQVGTLLGIQPISQTTQSDKFNNTFRALQFDGVDNFRQDLKHFQLMGGLPKSKAGVLGSPTYILLNDGRVNSQIADGGLYLSRRLSESIFREFLCKTGPYLRPEDVAPIINEGSKIGLAKSFRTGNSCQTCHASLDPMASAYRNVTPQIGTWWKPGRRTLHLWTHGSTSNRVDNPPLFAEDSSPSGANAFFRRQPYTNLLFRSADGSLVSTLDMRASASGMIGVEALGAELAKTNDFYACMASRMLYFFTGIGVNLNDLNGARLSDDEMAYRTFVWGLGLELKEHQSMTQLAKDIMRSDMYRRVGYRLRGSGL
jgi:hypothetical protein